MSVLVVERREVMGWMVARLMRFVADAEVWKLIPPAIELQVGPVLVRQPL